MKFGILTDRFVVNKTKSPNLGDDIFCIVREVDGYSVIRKIGDSDSAMAEAFGAFYIDEITDFKASGILSSVLEPLSKNNISVLVVSAYNRDYIFVLEADFKRALGILKI